MNTIVTDNPYGTNIVSLIMKTTGSTKAARLNALSAFLNADGIKQENLHSKASQVFVTQIHTYLMEKEMKEYIEHILSNPKSIILDPIILEIYNGSYTILPLTPEVQGHVATGVSQTLIGD